MKTNLTGDRNILFKWACKSLKFFLLTLVGFAIACVMSQVIGAEAIAQMLLSVSVWEWLGRTAIFILCWLSVAIIYESSR